MATTAPINVGNLITRTPGVQGGQPCLAGTRIRVQTVAVRHEQGLTAEEIWQDFPHVDLARIYAALAYYYANKGQIDAEIEDERRLGEELEARYPHGWTRENHQR